MHADFTRRREGGDRRRARAVVAFMNKSPDQTVAVPELEIAVPGEPSGRRDGFGIRAGVQDLHAENVVRGIKKIEAISRHAGPQTGTKTTPDPRR